MVLDSVFPAHCHARSLLTTALSQEFKILSACRPGATTIQFISTVLSMSVAILSARPEGKQQGEEGPGWS